MPDEEYPTGDARPRRWRRVVHHRFGDAKHLLRRWAAIFWRRRFYKTTFVGITGSHGKSTTTAVLGRMLAAHAPTYFKHGDNQLRAAPRTVLSTLPWHHLYSVQEVSAERPGAIEPIVEYLRPTVGIVTAIGGDHRKAFRSFEATAAEKAKLVHCLPADGLAVLNVDDPLVAAMADGCSCKVVTYGRAESADLRLVGASSAWPDCLTLDVAHRGEGFAVRSRLVGSHWATSVLAALLTALELGVDKSICLDVVARFDPLYNRMSVHPTPWGGTYILDAYKASFSGIETCLGFLAETSAPRKTVVVGTIADYAGASRSHYYKVARAALDMADRVIFTGTNAPRVRRLASQEFSGRLFAVERPSDVIAMLSQDPVADEIIYIKATRADGLAGVFVPVGKG